MGTEAGRVIRWPGETNQHCHNTSLAWEFLGVSAPFGLFDVDHGYGELGPSPWEGAGGSHRGTPDRTQVVCGGFSPYRPPGLLAGAKNFLDLPEILITAALWE